MPTTIAVRHVPFEDLGILAPLLSERGHSIAYRDAGIDALDARELGEADLLVVLGGPIGVYETGAYPFLAGEIDAVAGRIARGRPTLGICLGAQIIASAAGAAVGATGRKEIGYAPITLTPEGAASPLARVGETPVLHWHGDAFEIPPGATRLAETPGFPNQAFAMDAAVLGLQFHLEADRRRIERWLIGHAHELSAAGMDPNLIRAQAAAHGQVLEDAGRDVFGAWLDALD